MCFEYEIAFLTSICIATEPLHGHLTKIAQAESDNTNEIIVSWKKYSTCNFYEVEIKRKSSAKPEIILTVKNEKEGNVDEQFCTYLCKSPGDTYVFRVRCQCNSLFGFWSEERVYQLGKKCLQMIFVTLHNQGYEILRLQILRFFFQSLVKL